MIRSLFCGHKWKTHSKKEMKSVSKRILEGTEFAWEPIIITTTKNFTQEVLVCEKCGKIKTIKY